MKQGFTVTHLALAITLIYAIILGITVYAAFQPKESSFITPVAVVHAAEPVVIADSSPKGKIMRAWGPVEGEKAAKVAFCESSLDPRKKNSSSSAAGLYQILKGTWKDHGCTGNPYNADDNIACAYKIYQKYGWDSTASWSASRGCWRNK